MNQVIGNWAPQCVTLVSESWSLVYWTEKFCLCKYDKGRGYLHILCRIKSSISQICYIMWDFYYHIISQTSLSKIQKTALGLISITKINYCFKNIDRLWEGNLILDICALYFIINSRKDSVFWRKHVFWNIAGYFSKMKELLKKK